MDDIVARYTLKFNDLATKGLLRSAKAARAFSLAGTAAIAGIAALTAGVIALSKASFSLAGDWAEYYDSLDETAQAAGVSAGYLRNLSMALSDMGVDQEVANKGIIKFNRNLGEFRASGIPKVLSDISGNFGYLTDKTLGTEQALNKTLETIAALPDAAARSAALAEIFGKAGPLMGAAVNDLAALTAGMKIYNDILGEVTDEQLKSASDYSSSLLQAGAAWKAIKLAIGQAAAPLFIPMIKNFVEFLVANKDKITSGFADAFAQLGTAMQGIDWGAVLSSMAKLISYIPVMVSAFTWLIDNIGLVATVIGAVKVGGFISQLGFLLPMFSKINLLIGGASGFIGILKNLIPMILNVGRVILTAMGPVGWAIAAAVAAGVLLYQNWDLVKATALSLWAGIKTAWGGITSATSALWGAITGAWDSIDQATGGFLTKMVNAASSIVGFVFAPIKAGIALLSGDFSGALSIMQNAWGKAWNAMGSLLSGIWSGIKNVVATGANFLIDKINWLIQKYNALAPSFAQIGTVQRMGTSNAASVNAAAGRQRVAVAVTINGEVKGAQMRAPSVRTAQAPRSRGNNHPAGARR